MENITVEKYIAGIRQELLPKYHLSRHSIDDITTFYRHRLSDKWNPSSLHYHFLVSTSTEETNQELALSICRSFVSPHKEITILFPSEKEFLASPEQLLEKGNNAFVIIGECIKEPLDEDGINQWTAARKILNNPKCPTCFLLLSIDEFQTKFKDTPVYEPLFNQVFRYHLETNTSYSQKDYLDELNSWLDEQFPVKRTESFDRGMNDYLSAVLAKPHTNEGIEFLEDLKKRFQYEYYKYEDLDVIDERCVPYYHKVVSTVPEKSANHIPHTSNEKEVNTISVKTEDEKKAEKEKKLAALRAKCRELKETTPIFTVPKNGDFFDLDQKPDPDEGTKNLLLLTLSTLREPEADASLRPSYVRLDPTEKPFEYRYQLEPVPAKLMHDFAKSTSGEKLDGILMICSPQVLAKRNEDEEIHDERFHFLIRSAYDYFICATSDYARKQNKDHSLSYKEIPTDADTSSKSPDTPEQRTQRTVQFINKVVTEIRKLKKHYPNMNIHVDTHGGLRNDQEILNSILSLLQMEGISIPESNIHSVEYSGSQAVVTSDSEIFKIMNFVSGIHECIYYGQTASLKQAMDPEKSEQADSSNNTNEYEQAVLTDMQTIAEGIQLCDVNKFEKGLEDLSNAILKLDSNHKGAGYLTMFKDLISNSYGEQLLSSKRQVIDEVRWCTEKGFIQQALTLVESKMPKSMIQHKFLVSETDAKHKRLFSNEGTAINAEIKEALKDKGIPKDTISPLENVVVQQTGYKRCEWKNDVPIFIKLNELPASKDILEKGNLPDIRLPKKKTQKELERYEVKLTGSIIDPNDPKEKKKLPTEEFFYIRENPAVIKEKTADSDKIINVSDMINVLIRLHMQLKQERNATNHAGENETRSSVALIKNALECYIALYNRIVELLEPKDVPTHSS